MKDFTLLKNKLSLILDENFHEIKRTKTLYFRKNMVLINAYYHQILNEFINKNIQESCNETKENFACYARALLEIFIQKTVEMIELKIYFGMI